MTATETDQLVALEAAYIEALGDEALGAHGRAMQIASDPALRDHVVSVRMDQDAVTGLRILLRDDHVSGKRLRELRLLRDKADTKLGRAEAALADAQRDTDTAKHEHEQLEAQVGQCERGIESVQYRARAHRFAGRAVAAEIKAAGIDV